MSTDQMPAPPAQPTEPRNGMAITALCLGVVGVLLGLLLPGVLWFLIIPLGALALIFSLVGVSRVRKGRSDAKKMTWSGTTLGVIALALGIWGVVIFAQAMQDLDKAVRDFDKEMSKIEAPSIPPMPEMPPAAEVPEPPPMPEPQSLPSMEECMAMAAEDEYGNPPQVCLDAYPEAGDANVADPSLNYQGSDACQYDESQCYMNGQQCATGSCVDAARGNSPDEVEATRDEWLRENPGYCPVGETGAVAPC